MTLYVKDETLMWLWHSHVTGCTRESIVETACCWPKFTDQLLKSAYGLVYGYLESTDRDKPAKQNRQNRSNADFRRRVVEDILDVFEYSGFTSLEHMPVFVAADPSVLPPQSPTSADLAVILRTLSAHAERLAALEAVAVAGPSVGTRGGGNPVAISSTTTAVTGGEGVSGSASGDVTSAAVPLPVHQQVLYSDAAATRPQQPTRGQRGGQLGHNGTNASNAGRPSSGTVHAGQSQNNDWINVGKNGRAVKPQAARKRNRVNVVRGKMDNDQCSIKGVPRQKHIFVSRTGPDTTCADVIKWIADQCSLTISCEKLETKGVGYASFRLTCSEEQSETLLNADVWPNNIIVRPWYGSLRVDSKSNRAHSGSDQFTL